MGEIFLTHTVYIAEKYIYWATIPLLTIRVYLHSFSCYCLRNMRNVTKFQENLTLAAVQDHPRSSILVSMESSIWFPISH